MTSQNYYRLPYIQDILYTFGFHPGSVNKYIEREYEDGLFCYQIFNINDKTNCLFKFDANESEHGWPP